MALSQEKRLFASFTVLLLEHQWFRTFPGWWDNIEPWGRGYNVFKTEFHENSCIPPDILAEIVVVAGWQPGPCYV